MSDLVERLEDLRKSMESWNSDADLIAEAAARIKALEDGLLRLLERCDESEDAFYGTISTKYVRDIARALLGGSNGE